jgi:uncharacterized protein
VTLPPPSYPPYGPAFAHPPAGPPPGWGQPVWVPDPRPRLDVAISRMRAHDPRPWGWRPAILPAIALVLLVVVTSLIAAVLDPGSYAAALTYTALLEGGLYAVLTAVVIYSGREVARRYGGFGNAFGLRKPVWRDLAWVAAGIGMVLVARIAISVVAYQLGGTRALQQSQNLQVSHPRVGVLILLGLVACVAAPAIEETIFRGLLLRTLMWRLGFWPAALLSSVLFGAFHTYEVSTLAGALVLASVTASLGLVNCLLVRWTERLTPGIGVHTLFNALAVVVLAVSR